MNCAGVEKLLSLYTEGDLSEKKARIIYAHISSCEACLRAAEEFRESQERLRNFGAPEFGQEFYDEIRGKVLAEIAARPVRQSSFMHTIAERFSQRPALAYSFAALLLFFALSFGLYRSLVKEQDAPLSAIEKSMMTVGIEGFDTSMLVEESVASTGGSGMSRMASQRILSRTRPAQNRPENTGRESSSTDVRSSGTTAAKVVETPGKEEAATAPVQTVARIEFQTSDPNIRIIWLAPKTSE